jgi:hypothetical protein
VGVSASTAAATWARRDSPPRRRRSRPASGSPALDRDPRLIQADQPSARSGSAPRWSSAARRRRPPARSRCRWPRIRLAARGRRRRPRRRSPSRPGSRSRPRTNALARRRRSTRPKRPATRPGNSSNDSCHRAGSTSTLWPAATVWSSGASQHRMINAGRPHLPPRLTALLPLPGRAGEGQLRPRPLLPGAVHPRQPTRRAGLGGPVHGPATSGAGRRGLGARPQQRLGAQGATPTAGDLRSVRASVARQRQRLLDAYLAEVIDLDAFQR